jgi:hypothetical protein
MKKEHEMSFIRIVTFAFITCATATSFAQEIKGIGDFTIGMSLEEFMDLPLIKKKNIKDKTGNEYGMSDANSVWKTTVDSQVEEDYRVYSADVVKLEFKAPMGVPKKFFGKSDGDSYDVTTLFYKGKLTKVHVYIGNEGMEFKNILTTKYGKPIKEDKTKSVICQNGYGAQSPHLDGLVFDIWGKGAKITATLQHFFHDCGYGSQSYWVEEGAIVNIMDRIDKNGRKALEAEDAQAKAAASKL